tara:strand:- start:585 stop:1079 length:495 start_codon:yes stop_codon:yes gene_type:complete
MKITKRQLRRIIREQIEEEQERSELDKIKEVFANGGAQAIELADMVGLGDDPAVYEMKEIVKVVVEILDVTTEQGFSGLPAGEYDQANQTWLPLVKKSLKKIYGDGLTPPRPDPQWNEQFQSLHADMKKLMRVYWGWYHPRLEDGMGVIENLADWAGHPVEIPE